MTMADAGVYSSTVEVAASPAHGGESPDLMKVSGPLMTLTWVTFIVMCLILYKVAWKPILRGLDRREQAIRKALEDAEKARQELAAIEERGRRALEETSARSREMLEAARQTAALAAEGVRQRAAEEGQRAIADARREIESATAKARESLRADSADLAVRLAAKVVGEAMDPARGRALVERLLKEMNA
jgi:F-type H+-transporting ATPase subunit b